jgi:NADPH2:quinone reductase
VGGDTLWANMALAYECLPSAVKLQIAGLRARHSIVATFEASLDSLKRRGLMVCMGTASGTVPPFDPQVLAMKGSLFLTRPALADYISDAVERDFLLSQLFGRIAAGDIKVEINQRFALSDAAEAHRALESRATTGCSILEP